MPNVNLKKNSWEDCLEGIIGSDLWVEWRLKLQDISQENGENC